MTLSSFDYQVLQIVSSMKEATENEIGSIIHQGSNVVFPFYVYKAIERLQSYDLIRESRLWRYEITDAGRAALKPTSDENEPDPLQLVYEGVARGH